MKSLLAQYQACNPEKFNEDFIYSKNREDIIGIFSNIMKAIEVIPGIKFMGAELVDDESTFDPIIHKGESFRSVLPSELQKIRYTMHFDCKGESETKTYEIFVNRLIDGAFFINEGVTFFPIFQILDNGSYPTKNGITLRSLLLPIVLQKTKKITIDDTFGNSYTGDLFVLALFNRKINPLLYFMCKYGMQGTIDFFKLDKQISIISICEPEEGFIDFKLNNKFVLRTTRDALDSNPFLMQFIILFSDLITTHTGFEEAQTMDYWYGRLSKLFNKNQLNPKEKVDGILMSLERAMDESIRKILRYPEEAKQNFFTITKYMLENFDELYSIDNISLENKRLRLWDYLFEPLRKFLSTQVIKLMNMKQVSLDSLKRPFNSLFPMFLIKSMVANELLRCANCTNDLNLYSTYLRYTMRGPQSLSGAISIKQRDLHPSYVGRLSLVASSAGDPGVTGTIVPFVDEYDFFFSPPPENEENQ